MLALEPLPILVLVLVPSLSEPTEERVAVEVSAELELYSLGLRLDGCLLAINKKAILFLRDLKRQFVDINPICSV